MGNDPGRPLVKGQVSRVIIRVKGPLDAKPAKSFKRDLTKLLKKYRAKVAVRKKPSGR